MDPFVSLWKDVKEEIKANVSETIYRLWLEDLEFVCFEGEVVTLSTIEYKKSIITSKFMNVLNESFEKVFGFGAKFNLIDRSAAEEQLRKIKEDEELKQEILITENTFDTFVVGPSNKFAHAAALAVAANPGKAYNPLFIYGNSGLGKTHLLKAIGEEIKKNNPSASVMYTHGEDFTNELILYLNLGKMKEFHDKYRNNDVLLVDDVQFIGGKETTQEEFFHTFNALTDAGRQIVLSSDRPPKEIARLDDRLTTRFEWGLLADIQPPDIETRMAIIQRIGDISSLDMDSDIVLFLAEKIKSNIRQIEGVVRKVKAYADLDNTDKVTMTMAQRAIQDILRDNQPPVVTVEKIIFEVARTFNMPAEDIRGKKQDAVTSRNRQISMYIVSEMTNLSTKAIGAEFGGKDHTTVLYAIRKIKNEVATNSNLRNIINDIIKNVQEGRS